MLQRRVLLAVVLLALAAQAAATLAGGMAHEGSSKTASFETDTAHMTVEVQSGSGEESSSASSSSSSGSSSQEQEQSASNSASAAGESNGHTININFNSNAGSSGSGEAPCTSNCDASVQENPSISGPMHYSQPLGDLESGYAPVAGSQTEARPTPVMSMPISEVDTRASTPPPPAPVAPAAPAAPGSVLDTPIVSAGVPPPSIHAGDAIAELKDAADARQARAALQKKAGLHAAVANAQDQLQYISKMQRELRYQYSELQLKHAGLRGQVRAAQLELQKMNENRPSFRGSENDIGMPLKELPNLSQQTPSDALAESTDPHARIEEMLRAIMSKLDRPVQKEEKSDENKAAEEEQKAHEAELKAEQSKKAEEREKEQASKAARRAAEEKKKSDLPAGFSSIIAVPQSEIRAQKAALEAKEKAEVDALKAAQEKEAAELSAKKDEKK